jgi:hypothetical protein
MIMNTDTNLIAVKIDFFFSVDKFIFVKTGLYYKYIYPVREL